MRLLSAGIVGLAAAVVLAGGGQAPPLRRLRSMFAGEPRSPSPDRGGLTASVHGRRTIAAGVGLCLLIGLGGLAGAVVGTVAAVGIDRALARLPDRAAVRAGEATDRDLPLALDLLACALRAGQPPSAASAAVATAIGGPVGAALAAVARGTDLGSPPELAWQPLGRLPGAAAASRTLARAAGSGTRLADELSRTAALLRHRRDAATDARVRRAGVLVVLPLGLCFLPAFVCVGVVPIVIGIAGSVLR